MMKSAAALTIALFAATSLQAATLTTVLKLGDAGYPYGSMILGADSLLYGTTATGGTFDRGTVFSLTQSGVRTTLASFNCPTSCKSFARLERSADGVLYGTIAGGYNGPTDFGSVFRVDTGGNLTTIHQFDQTSGAFPYSGVTFGNDGKLYGLTQVGGAYNKGTLFSLTTTGAYTKLVDFDGNNGAEPASSMVLGNDGSLFGTTALGGAFGGGTVFRYAPGGSITTLASFTSGTGIGDLGMGPDGTLYGLAVIGAYSLTPNGVLTIINANIPFGTGGLLLRGNHLYGTSEAGGSGDFGSVFRVALTGELEILADFTGPNGAFGRGSLVDVGGGKLFGLTELGPFSEGYPLAGRGTVFSISVPEPANWAMLIAGFGLIGAVARQRRGKVA